MADPTPNALDTVPAIPFWKSPVFISLATAAASALVAKYPEIGKLFGMSDSASVQAAVSNFFAWIAIAAPVIGGTLRVKSKVQPLTVTPKQAENHPNTVAHIAATGKTPPLTTKEPT